MNHSKLLLAGAIAAVAAMPVAAGAKPGHGHGHGYGHSKPHNVSYVFKGAYAGSGVVSVAHGNAHARKAGLVGIDVAFELTSSKVTVKDTNLDGVSDTSDVLAEDKVVVKAKLPKGDPGVQPFAAKHLVDQTNPDA
jgi:hypothetical protein